MEKRNLDCAHRRSRFLRNQPTSSITTGSFTRLSCEIVNLADPINGKLQVLHRAINRSQESQIPMTRCATRPRTSTSNAAFSKDRIHTVCGVLLAAKRLDGVRRWGRQFPGRIMKTEDMGKSDYEHATIISASIEKNDKLASDVVVIRDIGE